jgi:serine/threonine protein kinase
MYFFSVLSTPCKYNITTKPVLISLKASQPSSTQKLEWAIQLADAPGFIHEQGIIHCDLNLGNILRSTSRGVIFCDFALTSSKTQPEQARRSPIYTTANTQKIARIEDNIFAYGSICYEIFDWQRLFPEEDEHDQDELDEEDDVKLNGDEDNIEFDEDEINIGNRQVQKIEFPNPDNLPT